MTGASPVLVIENLRKDFGSVNALAGIDVTLDGAGVFGFLGPNGAGKSTTFKIISTLLRPTSGRVLIDGVDVHKEPRRAVAHLGVQFDASAFYPYLTATDNLRVQAIWCDAEVPGERIRALLSQVGLEKAAKRKVGGFSWGMRQRLGLASALLADPRLLLLDEPTNGLDPAGIADMRALLPKLAHDESRTIFMSSHRMDDVERVCDHVTIINEGTIVASGRPRELASGGESLEDVFLRLTRGAPPSVGARAEDCTR